MGSSSTSISDLQPNSNSDRLPESKQKRRGRIATDNEIQDVQINQTQWKSPFEQQIYSTKLIEALRRVRRNPNSPAFSPFTTRAVRETADQVLAVTAKGRTRWSRAIITARLRFKLNQKSKNHKKLGKLAGDVWSKKRLVKKRLPPLQRKVKVLRRLIPGCRKLSFPILLEEATDYIAALEMQVRAMTTLAGLRTGSAAGSLAAPSVQLGSNLC
ncbi:unnamed protein product [Ilex paraguariensis]|uniref:BHLH domain-containing protein n=1 Tax=Ilex paraguariensis TaxID=185542 RepID=A0ABC8SB27_9AQUA